MDKVKCPKCRQKTELKEEQQAMLDGRGEILVLCSHCGKLFTHEKKYKRPAKYVLYTILGIGTSLKHADMETVYRDYFYLVKTHCVSRRVCIPNGPQGYLEIRLPKEIRTKEELVDYLKAREK